MNVNKPIVPTTPLPGEWQAIKSDLEIGLAEVAAGRVQPRHRPHCRTRQETFGCADATMNPLTLYDRRAEEMTLDEVERILV